MAKPTKKFINDLIKVVNELNSNKPPQNKYSPVFNLWGKVYKEMSEIYPEIIGKRTQENLRGLYRSNKPNSSDNIKLTKEEYINRKRGRINLEDKLLSKISRPIALHFLTDLFKVSEDDVFSAISKLRLSGYTGISLWRDRGVVFVQNVKKLKQVGNEINLNKVIDGNKNITIGVVSDTHMGSEYHDLGSLNDFYDECVKKGITTVLHAGDISEGFKSSRMETFLGNTAIGFTAQLDYIVEKYPKRDGITTYFILGNHDLWYTQGGLANIGKAVADRRPDLKYIGDEFARVWLTPKVDVTLFHPRDGSASNVFTKLQNFVDRANDKVSKINIIGHYHKKGWLEYKDVYVMYPASFQRQSHYMNINNLRSEVGALMLTLEVDGDGYLKSLTPKSYTYDQTKPDNSIELY